MSNSNHEVNKSVDWAVISRGLKETLRETPTAVRHIIEALDRGYKVTIPGCVYFEKSKFNFFFHTGGEQRKVYFFVGKRRLKFELDYKEFEMSKLKYNKGWVTYGEGDDYVVICHDIYKPMETEFEKK